MAILALGPSGELPLDHLEGFRVDDGLVGVLHKVLRKCKAGTDTDSRAVGKKIQHAPGEDKASADKTDQHGHILGCRRFAPVRTDKF